MPNLMPRRVPLSPRFRVVLPTMVGLSAALLAMVAAPSMSAKLSPAELAMTFTAPASPPAPLQTGGGPRYQNYAPPPALGQSAGEPSIGVNPDTGKVFYVARTQTLRINFDDCSSPAKALWEDVTPPNSSGVSLDPILFTDQITGRTFTSQLLGKTSELFFSDNDGQTWSPSQGSGINSGVDHQTIGGGPFAPGAPPHPLYANATYYCSQDAALAQCGLSLDGGQTFGPAVPIYNITQCAGIHGHVKVAPDGTVYVPNKSCGTRQGVAVSGDNGITWTVRTIPDSISVTGIIDPSVGIGTDGTLYFAYRQGGAEPGLGRAMVTVSQNKGVNWSSSVDVGTAFNLNNVTFPEAVAGDGDRAAVAFIGTPTDGNYQAPLTTAGGAGFKGEWHLYIAHSYNRGATWTMIDATPTDPVQRNSICNSGTTCTNTPDDRNLLDFNDMTVDEEGRALVAYADGCVSNACIQGLDVNGDGFKDNNYTAIAKVARQSGGRRLFSQFDPTEPAVPGAPNVTAIRDGSGVVQLSWPVPDDGGSPITGYNVYRRTAAGTYPAPPLATVTTNNYADTTADATTSYFYRVTAINAIGESPFCGEVAPAIAADPCIEPGIPILADGTGDALDMQPSHDVQALSLSEPFAVGSDKLVITLKVASLSTVPPDTNWPVQFNVGATIYTARMTTVPPGTPVAPRFEFFQGAFNALLPTTTVADAASSFSADGTIRIVVPRSGVGNPAIGSNLTNFLTRIQVFIGASSITPDNMPDSLAPSGSYPIIGNAICRPNLAPIAVLTANPQTGDEPLLVNFDASGSTDPDTAPPADTIASYTFNFGDGSPAVTRTVAEFGAAAALVSHTYNDAGSYPASLTVKDSRNKVSVNVAEVVITVNEVVGGLVNYALTLNGGVAIATSHPSGRFPADSAINGVRNGATWGSSTGGWNDATRNAYPDILEVDFNSSKIIGEINVITLQNNWTTAGEPTAEVTPATGEGILDFIVQYCSANCADVNPNLRTWTTIPGGNISGNDKAWRQFTLSPAVTTTKIRVVVTNARNNWSRIVELEAIGASGQ